MGFLLVQRVGIVESRGRTSESVLSGSLNIECAKRLVSKGKDASLTHSGVVSPPPRGSVTLRPTTPLLTKGKTALAESRETM